MTKTLQCQPGLDHAYKQHLLGGFMSWDRNQNFNTFLLSLVIIRLASVDCHLFNSCFQPILCLVFVFPKCVWKLY